MDWCLENPEGIPTTDNPIAMLSENVHHPILPVAPTINHSNLPVVPPVILNYPSFHSSPKSSITSNRAAAENEKDKHKDKLRQQVIPLFIISNSIKGTRSPQKRKNCSSKGKRTNSSTNARRQRKTKTKCKKYFSKNFFTLHLPLIYLSLEC